MAKDFRHTSPKAHSVWDELWRFHTSARGIPIHGKDDVIVRQRQKYNIDLLLIPAPWSVVLMFAILNSIAIFWTRIVWIEYFGRPQFFAHQSALEEEYKELQRQGVKIPEENLVNHF